MAPLAIRMAGAGIRACSQPCNWVAVLWMVVSGCRTIGACSVFVHPIVLFWGTPGRTAMLPLTQFAALSISSTYIAPCFHVISNIKLQVSRDEAEVEKERKDSQQT